MGENLYTAGIFAKKAGVTIRTIRFYDKKDLLKPSAYNEAGYRLYTDSDFAKLQKILTLKYLGFSLTEIRDVILDEEQNGLKNSLELQSEIINNKINHMKLVAKAIDEAECTLDKDETLDWNKVIDIIRVINMEKNILNQYRNSSNLIKRISIHDRFSTNKIGWYSWLIEKFKISDQVRIFELGCGNGMMWSRNIGKLPKDCCITLTDISEGMLKDAEKNIGEAGERFTFEIVDANNIPFKDESFDIVIANHMLFYCSDRDKVFSEVRRVLKQGGYFYCSTVGEKHMEELDALVKKFDKSIIMSEFDLAKEFGLENGEKQLRRWFQNIKLHTYEDSLVVTEVEPLVQYIYSTHGNAKETLMGRLPQFEDFIREKLTKEGSIFISKKSGLFESRKL